jgi:hypothetical protein
LPQCFQQTDRNVSAHRMKIFYAAIKNISSTL